MARLVTMLLAQLSTCKKICTHPQGGGGPAPAKDVWAVWRAKAVRISDERFDRDLRRIRLAWRLIGHGARTQTIRRWTGLSEYRIRSLYRDYGSTAASRAEPRHRGRSPGRVTFFWQSAQLRCEAAILAGFLRLFGPLPLAPMKDAKTSLPGIPSGEQFCESYERFRSLAPDSQISIEHAVLLLLELAHGTELRLDICADCETALVLVDLLAAGRPLCAHCARRTSSRDGAIATLVTPDKLDLTESSAPAGSGRQGSLF